MEGQHFGKLGGGLVKIRLLLHQICSPGDAFA
jgi:hypothetical protein